ncbi:MAG TPA: NADH-quinone oxidoreductase subunit G [Streptosporangiaceae bacterium]|nr:NADH-quinone oxidoreductase subunit G [Streptosporangiaceae bacterium]
MTVQASESTGGEVARPADGVTVTIDGFEITVPKGTLVIRAAEQLGIQIPRFCDHPLLDPVGACRQCLVHIEGQPKPPASCTTTCTEGMVVHTQLTSPVAEKAQRGIMEFLLVNHPLDCPMCDKGGECPLQNQAMSSGQGETRFGGVKRTFPKPVALSSGVLLDRERCVQCARCTRFAEQIAGDPLIELLERGPQEQVGVAEGVPFDSYFSGNTVQICPVGALTGAAYRFRARPFDLVSTSTVCEHCASGCRQRTDHRRGVVARRLAGSDPQVNEEWNCDKGRWAFTYATQPDRLSGPLVRTLDGVLAPASWPEAFAAAARGLAAARGRAGVLTGGRLTLEDAYAYAKFARVALGTNDIDMRARPHSAEEAEFLAANVAGRGIEVSYADLERAPAVLLAGFEPDDESPIVFLRLRKAVRRSNLAVYSIAPLASRGLARMSGVLLATVPGGEAVALGSLISGTGLDEAGRAAAQALTAEGAIILAGERLAEVPGALGAADRLARATGARLAWVPRRAGERGAIEAGALPNLLPGGRLAASSQARVEVARAWGVASLPPLPGRDTAHILAATDSDIDALVLAGVDLDDLPDPAAARAALEATSFVVSLELRPSAVTDRADVVLPVAAVAEKDGTFVNWEGRPGSFRPALEVPGVESDLHVLRRIADEMDVHLGLPDAAAARQELAALGVLAVGAERRAGGSGGPQASIGPAGRPEGVPRRGQSLAGGSGGSVPLGGNAGGSGGSSPLADTVPEAGPPEPGPGQAVLATWHQLLDSGRMQDGEPFLAGTARPVVARMSAATAAQAGTADGGKVTVATERGSLTAGVEVAVMPDRVVWLPAHSEGCEIRRELGAGHGSLVTLHGSEETRRGSQGTRRGSQETPRSAE